MSFSVPLIALTIAFAGASDSYAAGVTLEVRQMVDVQVRGASGKATVIRRELTAPIPPGGTVVYALKYQNEEAAPVADLTLNNAVHKNMMFVGMDVGPQPLVSVDQGKTFGPLDSARVVGTNGVTRDANATDVTHLRWLIKGPVPPKTGGQISYKARVR